MTQLFIEGGAFNLEHGTKRLYPQSDPDRGISMIDTVATKGMYTVVYDRISAELLLIGEPVPSLQTVVTLPDQLFHGPISDDRVLNPMNAKSFKEKSNVVVVNKTIFNRLKGELAVLDLVGNKYYIDKSLEELRLVKQDACKIPLNDFDTRADGHLGWYDKKHKKIVCFDEETLLQTPANVCFVQLPDWYKMDPIGTAKVNDMAQPESVRNDARYLNIVQMIVRPTATFQQVSETYLASIIRDNRFRKGLAPERIVIPRQRENRFKGL